MRKLALLTLFFTTSLAAQSSLCPQIQSLTQDSPAHWGISITTLDGTPLCQTDAAQLFRPASNAKLFTATTALALLGPNKTFETRVTGNLDPATGTVTGDLTLIGAGDANLDSGDLPYHPDTRPFTFAALEDLATQLAAKGVKTVTGNIIGDDTLFPYEPYPQGWEFDDLKWGFGAPVSALTIADNQLPLTITPGKLNTPATVTLDQHGVLYYTLLGSVGTIDRKVSLPGVRLERVPGTRTLRIFGNIGVTSAPYTTDIAIDDPAAYAAMALRQILLAHGITVTGTPRSQHQPLSDGAGFLAQLRAPGGPEAEIATGSGFAGSCLGQAYPPTLATHTSAPISDDILFTLKESQNLHAELLLHAVAKVSACAPTDIAGARMIRAFLLHAGIAPDDFLLYDGSGLSAHDLVTPRSLTQLLVFAAQQPWFPSFKAALPIGGVDGSLSSRFPGPLKGRIFAKTGTLGESRALSGFLTAASGHTLVFSILVDNHPPSSTADRTLMDHIVELTAASN